MRKLWAVFKREYRETVRKPSFLVMTVLAPFLMAALMVVPALLAVKGMGERRVALLDGTPRLLRPGGIAREAIEAAIGRPLEGPLAPLDDGGDGFDRLYLMFRMRLPGSLRPSPIRRRSRR